MSDWILTDEDYVPVLDGSLGGVAPSVTLDVNAATLLALTAQQLGLVPQAANKVWIGPITGADAVPIFRALAVADGATGISSYSVGDLLYASGATTLSKLADVAVGSYLASGGVGVVPTWATLNQAAVAGLTEASGPSFAHVHLTDAIADNLATNQGATTAFVQNQLASAKNPLGYAQGVHLTGSTSSTSGIEVAADSDINFGTGNFTVAWWGSLPDWTPSPLSSTVVFSRDGTTGFDLTVLSTSGLPRLYLNSVSYPATVAPVVVDGTAGWMVAVVTRESAGADGSIVFYFDGRPLGTSVTIPAGAPGSVDHAVGLFVQGSSSARTAGTAHSAILYNYALTAAQVLSLYRNGVDFADVGGSQTSLVTGDNSTFASDTGWWSKTSTGTVTIADGVAHFVNTPNGSSGLYKNSLLSLGKWFKLTYTISNMTEGGIKPYFHTTPGATRTEDGTYTDVILASGANFYFNTVGETTCDIDDVVLVPAGATLHLQPEGIKSDGWHGAANGLDATYPATGWSLVRQDLMDTLASPTFAGLDLTGITDGYVPYVGAAGLAASGLYWDSENLWLQIHSSSKNIPVLRISVEGLSNTADEWTGLLLGIAEGYQKAGIFFNSDGGSYRRGNMYFAIDNDANSDDVDISDVKMILTRSGDLFITSGTISCSDLADGYMPHHVSDAVGLANTGVYWDSVNSRMGIGGVPGKTLDVWNGGISLSITGLAHGVTDIMPTTASCKIETLDNAGGAMLWGISNATARFGLNLYGVHAAASPTAPAITLNGSAKDGTARKALLAGEIVLQVNNYNTALITVLGSGNTNIVGNLSIGTDDTTVGTLSLYGGGAGADGGVLNLYLGADDDGGAVVAQYYTVRIVEDDLHIGTDLDTDAIKLDSNKDMWLSDGDLFVQNAGVTGVGLLGSGAISVGIDDSSAGQIRVYGGDGGDGLIYIHNATFAHGVVDYYMIGGDGNGNFAIISDLGNVTFKVTADDYVSFGTYAAKGAEAFDGIITVKDEAGNTRKLMTCA